MAKPTILLLFSSSLVSFLAGVGATYCLIEAPVPAAPPDSSIIAQNHPTHLASSAKAGFDPSSSPFGIGGIGASPTDTEIAAQAIKTDFEIEQAFRKQLQTDPNAIHSLIQRYESEKDGHTKQMLRSVLATSGKSDVIELAKQLTSSNDTDKKREGLDLLKQLRSDSPEVRAMVKQVLATEQSPAMINQALAALNPTVVDPAETNDIVAQLRTLSQNADPSIRSQSILRLGQWDRTGESSDRLVQALSDPSPDVRQAAVFALAQSDVRNENVKAALIGMINNPSETKLVKGSALQVLERFPLSTEETANYRRMQQNLRG